MDESEKEVSATDEMFDGLAEKYKDEIPKRSQVDSIKNKQKLNSYKHITALPLTFKTFRELKKLSNHSGSDSGFLSELLDAYKQSLKKEDE